MGHSYLPRDDKTIERESDKGIGLIILHAITADGPLCAIEDNGRPIDDIVWKGNTCHPPTPQEDGKVSCETLWIAQSHTGDYNET
jgi:hypothetical protein